MRPKSAVTGPTPMCTRLSVEAAVIVEATNYISYAELPQVTLKIQRVIPAHISVRSPSKDSRAKIQAPPAGQRLEWSKSPGKSLLCEGARGPASSRVGKTRVRAGIFQAFDICFDCKDQAPCRRCPSENCNRSCFTTISRILSV